MATIACFELEPFERKFFEQQLQGHELLFSDKPLTARNAAKYSKADIVVVFVMSDVTAQVLAKFPKLSCIATMSTGYNHIDIDYAKAHGIKICTVPQYGSTTVAEYAFSLLLALHRNIVPAVDRTRKGEFEFKGLMGTDLAGKTLGVLGTGKIGLNVIKYAKAFGMRVIAYDAYPNKQAAKDLGFTYVTLARLCKESDSISLHLPLLDSTRHILSTKEFSMMKKGVRIINTGRGPLIDTQALNKALAKKIVGSAALDVLEGETDFKKEARLCFDNCTPLSDEQLKTLMQNHALVGRENVLITPHLAFYTQEAVQRILDTTLQNVKGALRKKYVNTVQ